MGGRSTSGGNRSGGRGRGSGRGNTYQRPKKSATHSKTPEKKEMKFMTNVAGKSQGLTYDTVKDHILQNIQKTLKNGEDLAQALRLGSDDGISEEKPIRHMAAKLEIVKGKEKDENYLASLKYNQKVDQEGLDMEYQINLTTWKNKKATYTANKYKAYAQIYDFCHKTLQNRIDKSTKF